MLSAMTTTMIDDEGAETTCAVFVPDNFVAKWAVSQDIGRNFSSSEWVSGSGDLLSSRLVMCNSPEAPVSLEGI